MAEDAKPIQAVEGLRLERAGAVATLWLDRPSRRNALTLAMWRAIPDLLAPLAEAPGLRALVVRGAGGAFAAGADIAEFQTVYASRRAALDNQAVMARAMTALEDFPAPTLAAIEGPCVGGGCGLALACDLRLADPDARFGITPARLGLVYGIDDTRRLVQAVGVPAARRILFLGELMDAAEAHRVGLVDQLAAPGGLDVLLADRLAVLMAASGTSQRATKAILRRLREGAVHDDDASRTLFADAFEGADFQEGRAAFMEKRPPSFR